MKLRCSDCREAFHWPANKDWPRNCPLCGARQHSDEAQERMDGDIVCMPSLRSAGTKANDKVYRDMETGSEFRAQAAAEMAGVPASEMSALKITDMKDNTKPGEIAAPPLNNSVTQFMNANPQVSGFVGASDGRGVGYSQMAHTGPADTRNVGARMRTKLQELHPQQVAKYMAGPDALNPRRTVAPSTDVVSERPGVETWQPGYRRRG
jgi:hypothetical protein